MATVSTKAFALRLGGDLYNRVKSTAHEKGVSMNELCVRLLSSSLQGKTREEISGLQNLIPQGILELIVSTWREEIEGISLI